MSSVFGQKDMLYEEELSFTPEFNKTNYNESIINYVYCSKEKVLKKGTAVVIMSSVFEHKESIETDKCVRFTRAPVAAFCLKLIVHYRAKTILKYHLNLFVCLMEGSGTKGNLALSLVN